MQINPYTTGKIVLDANRFVGRKEIIQNILNTLKTNQMIVVYGQRRIGKSSILSRLGQEIVKALDGYIPVFFDLQQHLGEPIEELLE